MCCCFDLNCSFYLLILQPEFHSPAVLALVGRPIDRSPVDGVVGGERLLELIVHHEIKVAELAPDRLRDLVEADLDLLDLLQRVLALLHLVHLLGKISSLQLTAAALARSYIRANANLKNKKQTY